MQKSTSKTTGEETTIATNSTATTTAVASANTTVSSKTTTTSEEVGKAAEEKETIITTIKDDISKCSVKDTLQPATVENKPLTSVANAASASGDEKRLRKSTRCKAKAAAATASNANGANTHSSTTSGSNSTKTQNKGRNRRNLFKKTPFKTPVAQATTHVVENVFYKGSYLQVGDIVSLVDNEDDVYYAQIRGLLIDNYCEKSAFLTWLIPTQASPDPKMGFDAATYLIGPDEELSRKLSCLEFVMHAPSNYYLDRSTPFPLPDTMEFANKPGGYIWTTLAEYQRKK